MTLILKFGPEILDSNNHLLNNIERKILETTTELRSFNAQCEAEYVNVGKEEAIMLVRLLWNRPEFKGLKVVHDEIGHSTCY